MARYSEGLPHGYHLCTIPVESPQELMRVNAMVEGAVKSVVDENGKILLVRHLIITDSEMTDRDTGEIIPVKRMTIITPDGVAYNTPSEYARRSLARQLAQLVVQQPDRLPPFDPPLRVKVELTPSRDRSKAPWLNLIILEDGNEQQVCQG